MRIGGKEGWRGEGGGEGKGGNKEEEGTRARDEGRGWGQEGDNFFRCLKDINNSSAA